MRSVGVGMTLDFENPPINEVIVGTFFQAVPELRAEHVGAFWENIRNEFPSSSQYPALILPGTAASSQMALPGELFPLPRFWFVSPDDTELIQLQRDAFFFNWRRREGDYPRFGQVFERFRTYFEFFCDFIRRNFKRNELSPLSFELTYVNLIGTQESVLSASDYEKVVPSLSFPRNTAIGSDVSEFVHAEAYQLGADLQLQVTHRSVRQTADGRFAVVMELKVTGKPVENPNVWFKNAHDIICKTFESSTSSDIQVRVWGKKTK